MNRRQTLGGLSPAQLNSRASFGPSRITKDGKSSKKVTVLSGRQSLAPKPANTSQPNSRLSTLSGLHRRSSTYGKKTTGPKQDPRPVSDKAYQQDCIRQLIEYLSTHGYEHPVSPKTLTSPMSKDVFSIVQFLLRQVDPHMKPLGKMEEDVPQLFKHLKYPFQISKSALFAVGSPHTWPGLLAAMNWVVELLNYAEKADEVIDINSAASGQQQGCNATKHSVEVVLSSMPCHLCCSSFGHLLLHACLLQLFLSGTPCLAGQSRCL